MNPAHLGDLARLQQAAIWQSEGRDSQLEVT